jgi:legumain
VYDGVRIDYRGPDVTAENFLSVLLGDASAVAGKGTGRVVDSGPHDKVRNVACVKALPLQELLLAGD